MALKKAGVLGATGSVGQRFILLLADHPEFELYALGASSRSSGKAYKDAVKWKQTSLLPAKAQDLVVTECKPEGRFAECDVVFSGLDSDVAGEVEKAFSEKGLAVISNAKNYRRAEDVPLIVPIVNTDHLSVVEKRVKDARAKGEPKSGFIVCISNCSTAGLVAPLKPLVDAYGPIDLLTATTLQAISGAGFSPGVSGIDVLDNVVPFISGEEEKMEWETKKILGTVNAAQTGFDLIPESSMKVSAQCNRIAVSDGHTECISLRFKSDKKPTVDELKQTLRNYQCEAFKLGCPSAPKNTIHVLEEEDRPQPRLDRDRDNGYGVSVGRVREDPVLDFKMVVLSHNTVIGAAGAGVLIAEILNAKNVI
ncbi:aspartate-semialdehyde dehydrogenase [Yamadazyma tenuis]|uniref:Aspartate-semialdehyde dehydrogenase n=1 Tax=Candida tenuis (strain ATCC 10573 / BCRC 21748 / CBS 615 / JCM 9827 / NBRC 10315 / NRRL Y-1498 / VKM Y-70) TaxID=590646 RepID=G3AWR8_CANTC|nr:aspartate-semialdehyde dehydrogenase [Yamadazyma tenuis ATCC 10573]EGV66598.1 aspartate-semialdehyde dehydrogenase [Yamadazyma tenuis ATCC 10573]WEJ95274.1 aspartate-semialdehyde dehydrogenase [Yamadazyma tenuis]